MTYDEYIKSIIETRGQWNIPENQYKEGHHIIPKCLGGEGNPKSKHENIIWLYPREHYIAHKLLLEKYPNDNRIAFAFSAMAFPKGKTKREAMLTPEEYEEARLIYSERIRGENNPMYGKPSPFKGCKMTPEQRLRLSQKLKGNGLGRPKSEETRQKMREAAKLRDPSCFSKANKGKIAITDGEVTRFISKNDQLPCGFTYGNCNTRGTHDMTRYWQNQEMQKRNSENHKGKNNSMYGNGFRVSGGKNGKAKFRYFYDDLVFECRKDLIEYLKTTHPQISENAIREIQNNTCGIRIRKKFHDIIEKLSWELKAENENKVNKKSKI